MEKMIEESIFNLIFSKETVFFGLFLYLFYGQQQDKRSQTKFIEKQQDILGEMKDSLSDLSISFERLTENQEKLTERIEKIEVIVDKGDIKNEK